jgi:hydrogenase expression/formation protein HypC
MCLAVPGRLVDTSGGDALTRSGRVDFGGLIKEVSLALVPEARVGDYVLVHVGFALTRVDEAEAQRVLDALRQIDALAVEEA